jgi:hypothetical protein
VDCEANGKLFPGGRGDLGHEFLRLLQFVRGVAIHISNQNRDLAVGALPGVATASTATHKHASAFA